MYAHRLTLPIGTPHVIVDPLEDFTEGAFVDCYGREDTEPIRRVVDELDAMTHEWQERCRLVLCTSSYRHNQFEVPGLEHLCTTEERRRCVIPEDRFDRTVLKFDNSLFSANVDLEELFGDDRFAGVEGLTTTSCVVQTIDHCRERMRHRTIVVPANAVGARASKANDALRILQRFADPAEKGVIVVPRWQDIDYR